MPKPDRPDRFAPETRSAISRAKALVVEFKHTHITPEMILLGLLQAEDPELQKGWQAAKASPEQIRKLVLQHLRPGETPIPERLVSFSERAKRVIETAREEAVRTKAPRIGPEHLLLGLTRVTNTVCSAVLRAVDLDTETVRAALASGAPSG